MELQWIIEDAGHQVVTCVGQPGGRRMVDELHPDGPPDLNLRDGPTGIEVADRMKNRSDVAVVFVTANAGRLGPSYHGALGAVDKPFTAATIRSVLSYVERRIISGADGGAPPVGLRLAGGGVEHGMWNQAEVA
jgi:hypothetical protein